MSDPLTTSRTARESLARGLNALQADPSVPSHLVDLAAPIAQAMGALHQLEQSNQLAPHAEVALNHVRGALAKLQSAQENHPAVRLALQQVATSLTLVHSLSRLGNGPVVPGGAPAAPPAQAAPAQAAPAQPPPAQAPPPAAQAAPQQQPAAPAPKPAPLTAPNRGQTGAMGQTAPVGAPQGRPPQAAPQQPPQAAPQQPSFPQPAPAPQPQFQAPQHAPAAAPAMVSRDPFAAPGVPAPAPTPGQQAAPAPGGKPATPSMPVPAPPPGGNLQLFAADLGAHSPTNFYKGLAGNDIIDHGGLFISTYVPPKIGTAVRLRVSLPGGYEFEANAVVKWTREQGGDAPPGFGAQFTAITPEAKQLVYRYVRNREPLFYDDF